VTENFDYKAVSKWVGWTCAICCKSFSPKIDECKYCNNEKIDNPIMDKEIINKDFKYTRQPDCQCGCQNNRGVKND